MDALDLLDGAAAEALAARAAAAAATDAPPGEAAAPIAAADAARVRQASNPSTSPEELRLLAGHSSPYVRGAVALNAAARDATNAALAADQDPRVRVLLARKLAALCPLMEVGEQAHLEASAARLLGQLVLDEATRVRAAIADVVKDMPDAPRALILRLARDTEISVCGPVIAVSPLLTAEDLLSLLTESPAPARRLAVARRPHLPAAVSDAMVRTGDAAAIGMLLSNSSAVLREGTLESIVAKASGQPDWHAPLVRRPRLSPRVAGALSRIVADDLLRELARRTDLPEDLVGAFRLRLAARLEPASDGPAADLSEEEAIAAARAIRGRGALSEHALFHAAEHGDPRLAMALLALAAELPFGAVARACRLRSAKGVVSLVWKAGFSMQVAEPVQFRLARIPPVDILRADTHGHYPLGIEEMRFQLDFLVAPATPTSLAPAPSQPKAAAAR
jgi:uncharacterized protein (DUF2336 family)